MKNADSSERRPVRRDAMRLATPPDRGPLNPLSKRWPTDGFIHNADRNLREWVRRRIGFIPLLEFRNQITMGPATPRIAWRESREVARLSRSLAGINTTASVACIVPTYRRHDRLVAAIDSILKQTFQDFVVIVVDDGGGLPSCKTIRG
jgi:hypothetical protein